MELIADVVRAARAWALTRLDEAAEQALMAPGLGAMDQGDRVESLLEVAAVLAGAMTLGYRPDTQPASGDHRVRHLVAHLVRAGAALDCGGVRELIAAARAAETVFGGAVLMGALLELVRLVAREVA